MKTRIYIMLIMLTLAISIAGAESVGSIWGYGVEVGIARGDNFGNAEQWVPSGRVFAQARFMNQLYGRLGIGYARLQATDEYSTKTLLPDARLYFIPIEVKGVAPFIYGGFGVSKNLDINDSDIIAMLPFGFGLQTALNKKVMIELNAGYNLAFSDNLDERVRNDNHLNRITNQKHDGYFDLMLGFTLIDPFGRKSSVSNTERNGLTEITIQMPSQTYTPAPDAASANIDTDGDGLADELETSRYGSDPRVKDSDGDGLLDGEEVFRYMTDPLKEDTDADGLSDGLEVNQYKTDPLKEDTDGDGLSDYAELMTHRTNALKIDTDGGGMNDGAEIQAGTNPLDPDDDLLDLSGESSIILSGVLFANAKATILPESERVLDKALKSLAAYPNVNITIVGHTDSVGNEDDNRSLSLRRAQSVRDWLLARSINADRIKVVGKGEAEPVASNESEEGRAQNRRIEFEVE